MALEDLPLPVIAHVFVRGNANNPGAETPPHFLSCLSAGNPAPFHEGSGRLELAHAIASKDNPLTARVIVNRVWLHHFGAGIVRSPSDFGVRGDPPSHPELLDYLAMRFMEWGWSLKKLHRMILLSATYQQSSQDHPEARRQDPENQLLWRMNRQRLDIEALRDSLLAISGELEPGSSGPHPFPHMGTWMFMQHGPFNAVYASKRRSVYLMTQRIQRHPYLALFDGPDTNMSTEKRTTSLVPLQALYLMNHPFVREQAEAFAKRMLAVSPESERRIAWGHETAWGRPASKVEVRKGVEYMSRYMDESKRAGESTE